tara:strand:+ start:293 stop:1570 length:1278 start_codon:yes stop_codon:yes gene_type:complete
MLQNLHQKRFHIAIGVNCIKASVKSYSKRLECSPEFVIENEYALFRTDTLNVSIRKVDGDKVGVCHLGWETCRREDQKAEIQSIWGVVSATLLALLIAKLPLIFNLDKIDFFVRNWPFYVMPILSVYFLIQNRASIKTTFGITALLSLLSLYSNWLPRADHTTSLAFWHMGFILWGVLGICYCLKNIQYLEARLNYLRYNGEVIILSSILLFGGGVLSALVFTLFSTINLDITELYIEYVVVWGLLAAPIISTYMITSYPELMKKALNLISKTFSILLLLTISGYGISLFFNIQALFQSRNALLSFNVMLFFTLIIIVFSISIEQNDKVNWILTPLATLVFAINTIGLVAICYRINEWGFTPNRLAVLGGNILIFFNLGTIIPRLWKSIKTNDFESDINSLVARFLPAYILWAVVVTFLFPILFK